MGTQVDSWQELSRKAGMAKFLYNTYLDRALKKYGYPKNWPNHISGIINGDFPENVKDRLRNLNRTYRRYLHMAAAARPKYKKVYNHGLEIDKVCKTVVKELEARELSFKRGA